MEVSGLRCNNMKAVATKKNPKQNTHLGLVVVCCLTLRLLRAERPGVSGDGVAAQPGLMRKM
jgi:hypothetical protein